MGTHFLSSATDVRLTFEFWVAFWLGPVLFGTALYEAAHSLAHWSPRPSHRRSRQSLVVFWVRTCVCRGRAMDEWEEASRQVWFNLFVGAFTVWNVLGIKCVRYGITVTTVI